MKGHQHLGITSWDKIESESEPETFRLEQPQLSSAAKDPYLRPKTSEPKSIKPPSSYPTYDLRQYDGLPDHLITTDSPPADYPIDDLTADGCGSVLCHQDESDCESRPGLCSESESGDSRYWMGETDSESERKITFRSGRAEIKYNPQDPPNSITASIKPKSVSTVSSSSKSKLSSNPKYQSSQRRNNRVPFYHSNSLASAVVDRDGLHQEGGPDHAPGSGSSQIQS